MNDLDQMLEFAVGLARKAAGQHRRYFRKKELDIVHKDERFDIVTGADKAAERVVVDAIRERFPEHSILTEESGLDIHNPEWEWVIDPLDGTTNFSAGLAHFNISIALEHRGETVVGVVYAPILELLFTAIKGHGAFCNGVPIATGSTERLVDAVVATGMPYDRATNPDNNIPVIADVATTVRGLRIFGSAALDLCFVASGRLDAFWEMTLHRWDVAAGALIASEAGAVVTTYRDDRPIAMLAANSALTAQLLPMLTHRAEGCSAK